MYAYSKAELWNDCGFGGKSTKFQTNVAEDILKEFRVYAKLDFSREAHKFQKSKMADTETKISVNCDIFGNNWHKNINEESFCMFLDTRNPVEPLFSW